MIDLNPTTFINHHIKHNSIDAGLTDFKLYPFQEEMVNNFHNNRLNICASSRQSGKSSCSQRWMCTETGFITNAGNLTKYQRKREIDTSKRKRIS